MSNNNEGAAFFAGLVIGGLVGAAMALIMAPQSGEETRAQIRDRSLDYKDRAEEGIVQARQQATEQAAALQEKSRVALEKSKQSASEAMEKGKQSATNALEKGKQSVSQVTHRTEQDGTAGAAAEA